MTALSLLVAFSLPAGDDVATRTLAGVIVDENGKPIAGAYVGIAAAGPKSGKDPFCPSCYPDCKKRTTTDAQGRFKIPGLDPSLKFLVLASLPEKKTQLVRNVDPAIGEIRVALSPLPRDLPVSRFLLGKVVNSDGEPVGGALISPGETLGVSKGIDAVVSAADGSFTMVLPDGCFAVGAIAEAAGFSGVRVGLLKPGAERHRLVLPEGAPVTGRLVYNGKPFAGARVAVVQTERSVSHYFAKELNATTDDDGRFRIEHVPSNQGYVIFSPIGAKPQKLVLTTKRFSANADGVVRNLGDLKLIPALRLAGRLEVGPNSILPPDARVLLKRDPAWDLVESAPVDKDGRFVFEGLPPEVYKLWVVADGLKIDADKAQKQLFDEDQGVGVRLHESIEDLAIPLQRRSANSILNTPARTLERAVPKP